MTPWQLRQAARALRSGGVIAYPTETVYGLGCDPLNPYAVETLLTIKQRPMSKGLILIGATLEQLLPYIDVSDEPLLQKLLAPCPHPTTWVVPARPATPAWLRGRHDTIAVRITAHPLAAQLCTAFGGAIVSTSANPAALPPARSALTVEHYFHDRLDVILHGGTQTGQPSDIRRLLDDRIIRGR
jgi:L-threonylcarbamoyladenylate synthase